MFVSRLLAIEKKEIFWCLVIGDGLQSCIMLFKILVIWYDAILFYSFFPIFSKWKYKSLFTQCCFFFCDFFSTLSWIITVEGICWHYWVSMKIIYQKTWWNSTSLRLSLLSIPFMRWTMYTGNKCILYWKMFSFPYCDKTRAACFHRNLFHFLANCN